MSHEPSIAFFDPSPIQELVKEIRNGTLPPLTVSLRTWTALRFWATPFLLRSTCASSRTPVLSVWNWKFTRGYWRSTFKVQFNLGDISDEMPSHPVPILRTVFHGGRQARFVWRWGARGPEVPKATQTQLPQRGNVQETCLPRRGRVQVPDGCEVPFQRPRVDARSQGHHWGYLPWVGLCMIQRWLLWANWLLCIGFGCLHGQESARLSRSDQSMLITPRIRPPLPRKASTRR